MTVNTNQENSNESTVQESGKETPSSLTLEELAKQITNLQQELNKAVNGISKKFDSKLESLKANPTTSTNNEETDKQELTIQALKSEYEDKFAAIETGYKKEIDSLKQEQLLREKKTLTANVRASLASEMAKSGFDDVPSAMRVFLTEHSEDCFLEGSDGLFIFKKDLKVKEDHGTLLPKLVEDWRNSSIGKRFIPADKLPNGAGLEPNTKPPSTEKQHVSKTEELLAGIKAGNLEFKSY